jgi:predicted nucleic acid-binding protein
VSRFLDTSVILGSLDPDEPHHEACDRLVAEGGHQIQVHALAETFSILTGGRLGRRLGATVVTRLIEDSVLPYVQTVCPSGRDMMAALAEWKFGVRS